MWRLLLSFYRPKVKAQQRVLEHMMLWHKHQLDCTTLIRIDEWRGREGGSLLRRSLHHRAHVLKGPNPSHPDPTHTAETSTFISPPHLMSTDPLFSRQIAFYYVTILLSCQLFWLNSSSIWCLQMESKVTAFYHFYWVGNEGIQLKFMQEEMVVIFYLTASEWMMSYVEWQPPC